MNKPAINLPKMLLRKGFFKGFSLWIITWISEIKMWTTK